VLCVARTICVFMMIMIFLLFIPLLFASDACNSSVVYIWNNIALDAIRHNSSSPPVASRVLAIMNVAIHDSISSITHEYNPHNFSVPTTNANASVPAAIIRAAYTTLTYLFPNLQTTFDTEFENDLLQLGRSEQNVIDGINVGGTCCVGDRANDGTRGRCGSGVGDCQSRQRWHSSQRNFCW
jgi:hypothetical protein